MTEEQKMTDEELEAKSSDELAKIWNAAEEWETDFRNRIDKILRKREAIENEKVRIEEEKVRISIIKTYIKLWQNRLCIEMNSADNIGEVVAGLIQAGTIQHSGGFPYPFAVSLTRLRDLLKGSPKKARELLSFLVRCGAVTPTSRPGARKGFYTRADWFKELLNKLTKEDWNKAIAGESK